MNSWRDYYQPVRVARIIKLPADWNRPHAIVYLEKGEAFVLQEPVWGKSPPKVGDFLVQYPDGKLSTMTPEALSAEFVRGP